MKIALLTLMHGYNYGGILQCFSLCRTLESLGHEVSVVDYHPFPKWRIARRLMYCAGNRVGNILEQKVQEHLYGIELHRKFAAFSTCRLNLTVSCNSSYALRRLSRGYDVLMVGSDQVWNLDWFTPAYFLSFAQDFPGQKVSYAASFGHANQPTEHQQQIGKWLGDFDRLTVRDGMSQKLVGHLCNRESQVVADPTLLCDLNDLAIDPSLPYSHYILLYALSKSRFDRMQPLFTRMRERLGWPIVAIKSDVLQSWPMLGVDYEIPNPGIEEWLGLFRNASFILTDSFHGTLFASKNRVAFLNYIGSDKSAGRVADVIDRYALHAGYPADPNDDALEADFDFDNAERQIEAHIAESLDFLRSLG